MKGNIAGLMQQAQKMQQEMQKAQEELANMEVTGQSGGGMVSVVMNGQHAATPPLISWVPYRGSYLCPIPEKG